jgi:hypothetical protein
MVCNVSFDSWKEQGQSQQEQQPQNRIRNDVDDEQRDCHRSHSQHLRGNRNYSGRHDECEISGKQIGGSPEEEATLLRTLVSHFGWLSLIPRRSACSPTQIQGENHDLPA